MSLLKPFLVKTIAVAAAFGYLACKFVASKRGTAPRCILIESVDQWKEFEKEITQQFRRSGVIGIDCEWVTVDEKRSPVSLLQLADESGLCVLIRLSCLDQWFIPSLFSDLLGGKDILKVGVGVLEDVAKLFSDYALDVAAFLDLRFLAQDLDLMEGKSLSLKSIGQALLGTELNKSKRLRCSDWDAPVLSDEQIKYAADDALIAAKIFAEIKRREVGFCSVFSGSFSKKIEMFTDMPYRLSPENNKGPNDGQTKYRVTKSNKTRYSKPRQKPMYDNCQLLAPDGEILCSCDRNKAEWYVQKGLGEQINDAPYTVRLNFEPSGRPMLDNVFYCQEKLNMCVVCGRTENFHCKSVVPLEYRKFFPDLMKKNLSHDVLLLCVHCHKKSNILDQQMRYQLADLCGAPLGSKKNVKYKFDPAMAHVKSAAKALSTSGNKIPEPRLGELKKIIGDHYKTELITDDLIQQALSLDATFLNAHFVPHGQKVYEYFCAHGGLIQFERMWRQHFLDSMSPQFLPDMWSVDHNHQRLAIQVINHEREVDFDPSILGLTPQLIEGIKELQQ